MAGSKSVNPRTAGPFGLLHLLKHVKGFKLNATQAKRICKAYDEACDTVFFNEPSMLKAQLSGARADVRYCERELARAKQNRDRLEARMNASVEEWEGAREEKAELEKAGGGRAKLLNLYPVAYPPRPGNKVGGRRGGKMRGGKGGMRGSARRMGL